MKKRLLFLLITIFALGFANLPSGNAQNINRAGLILQFSDGSTQTHCVEFSEASLSGYQLLERTGLAIVAEFSPIGAAVCKIDADGCAVNECLTCQAPMYWSYWQFVDGNWQYAVLGASMVQVTNGAVNGWVWGDGSTTPTVISFEQICAPRAAASPTPTNTVQPPTATPTAVSTATHTPQPTSTPQPTDTPTPIANLSENPTTTWTSAPSDTPSVTPAATQTPLPTNTPTPTWTATSTETPVPAPTDTSTPLPTDTSVPAEASANPASDAPANPPTQAFAPAAKPTNTPTLVPNGLPAKARPSGTEQEPSIPVEVAQINGVAVSNPVQQAGSVATSQAAETTSRVSGATLLAGAMLSYAIFGLLVLGLAVGLLVLFIIGRR